MSGLGNKVLGWFWEKVLGFRVSTVWGLGVQGPSQGARGGLFVGNPCGRFGFRGLGLGGVGLGFGLSSRMRLRGYLIVENLLGTVRG